MDTAKLVGEAAARFEQHSGANANWLSWGSRLLPKLARDTAQYQEQVAQQAAAAAERDRIERAKREAELMDRWIDGEITQEEYEARLGVAPPRIDVEMAVDTGDDEVQEVDEVPGTAEREKTTETPGDAEMKSTPSRKKDKGKGKATDKSKEKPKDPTTEPWWSSDLTLVRLFLFFCSLSRRRADIFDRISPVARAASRNTGSPSPVISEPAILNALSACTISKVARLPLVPPVDRRLESDRVRTSAQGRAPRTRRWR